MYLETKMNKLVARTHQKGQTRVLDTPSRTQPAPPKKEGRDDTWTTVRAMINLHLLPRLSQKVFLQKFGDSFIYF